jgi:DNA modification methylase
METRTIKLTESAFEYGNLNLRACGKDFFPTDVFGGPNRKSGIGNVITLKIEGMPELIKTDIPTDRISGKPRWIFRDRAWARAFVRSNKLQPGDVVTISRLAKRTYSVVVDGLSRSSRTAKSLETQIEECGLPKITNDRAVECTKESWIQPTFAHVRRKGQPCDYGTFKDSLNAPIHRWFKYPAGYSYRLVEEKIRHYSLATRHLLLDPFIGCGTTCVEAKRHGVNSIGIEAHPFVRWVAQTKVNWEIPIVDVVQNYQDVVRTAQAIVSAKRVSSATVPELVRKCYSEPNLVSLLAIRDAITREVEPGEVRDFLNLALTDALRNASKAATGWPYIAPAKMHQKVSEKEAFETFRVQVRRMLDDARFMQKYYSDHEVSTQVVLGDARNPNANAKPASVDLALTSPPYLNNYDYADRTRLETYFWGWYNTWREITENVRDKLIVSATTQVTRTRGNADGTLSEEIRHADPKLFEELKQKLSQLSARRLQKGGKKSYDVMVAGYFNDMLRVLKQVHLYLKQGSDFILVLGDSAPYGVYIPTHLYLARVGLGIGFKSYRLEQLRTRGDKWRTNPQRHKVALNEVILTLSK